MTRRIQGVLASGVLMAVVASVHAQSSGAGIYACTDSTGRKLTSDRPIAQCADREQKILNPSGTVKGKISPALTEQERALQDEKDKLLAEEKTRRLEEKRRDRALLARYPRRAVHDAERAEALSQVDAVVQAARNRMIELGRQRTTIDTEMDFYKKDPTKVPIALRRQLEDNVQSLAVQKHFVTDQESEVKRVNARFDEELTRLKTLWSLSAQGSVAEVKP